MTTSEGKQEVALDLSKHCIERAARRAYQELLNDILNSSEKRTDQEDALSLLKAFLEETDFPKLRSDHPELAGGVKLMVSLKRTAEGGWSTKPITRSKGSR